MCSVPSCSVCWDSRSNSRAVSNTQSPSWVTCMDRERAYVPTALSSSDFCSLIPTVCFLTLTLNMREHSCVCCGNIGLTPKDPAELTFFCLTWTSLRTWARTSCIGANYPNVACVICENFEDVIWTAAGMGLWMMTNYFLLFFLPDSHWKSFLIIIVSWSFCFCFFFFI